MKFTCTKTELLRGIGIVIKAAYVKYQRSILECIHIKAEGSRLLLDTFDMVTAIKTSVYAQVEEEGETAIPARVLFETVNKFPEEEIVFQREGTVLKLSGRSSNVDLIEMDAEQFPRFPELNGKKVAMGKADLKDMIEATAFSAYVGDDRPIFTGLLFEASKEKGTLSIVGIDGIRLAKNTIRLSVAEDVKAVIPAKTMKDASRILSEGEEEVNLYFSNNSCFIEEGETVIFTRLLDGEYMNYSAILPGEYKTRVKVETEAMRASLDLMMVLARTDSSNLIRMSVEPAGIAVSSVSEYGRGKNSVPAEVDGELLKIAFNARYLLDVFKILKEESVYMEFTGRLQACVIKPEKGEKFLYLVVPVNVAEQ